MICKPCAEMADFVSEHQLNEGHPPEVCLDRGKAIRACGCQHRPQLQELPAGEGRDLTAHQAVHGGTR